MWSQEVAYAATITSRQTLLGEEANLIFLKWVGSTAVPLIDCQTHVQYKHITRRQARLRCRNLVRTAIIRIKIFTKTAHQLCEFFTPYLNVYRYSTQSTYNYRKDLLNIVHIYLHRRTDNMKLVNWPFCYCTFGTTIKRHGRRNTPSKHGHRCSVMTHFNQREFNIYPHRPRCTFKGTDNLPYWIFQHCSCQLAPVITHIFNLSLTSGKPPLHWKKALITPCLLYTSPSPRD